MHSYILPFPQAQDLTEKVKSSGLEFPASFTLKKYLTAVNEWLNRAKAALAGSVPLRDLEKLLAEADKLAVDPGPKLPELQAKMDKALAWLEKVRKAVPKQRSTRRNAPDAEAEKVSSLRKYTLCKSRMFMVLLLEVLLLSSIVPQWNEECCMFVQPQYL